MGTSRTIAAALSALAVLGACGGASPQEPLTTVATRPTTTLRTTTTVATTTTTLPKPPEVLKAALLTPADVPGTTASPAVPEADDPTACFPGNPLAVKTDPSEVLGADLEVNQGGNVRGYGSSYRQATPERASAYVAAFATPAGSACRLGTFKASLNADPEPPKVDASGLTGSAVPVDVADGGAVLTVAGDVISQDGPMSVGFELLVFRKGGAVFFLKAEASRGPVVPGQSVELARKMASRLA